jgi:hypothetical protein
MTARIEHVWLYVIVRHLEQYVSAATDETSIADDLTDALPTSVAEELRARLLRILAGEDPKKVLDCRLPGGGFAKTAARDYAMTVDFLLLRNKHDYDEAVRLIEERWCEGESTLNNALGKYQSKGLRVLAELSDQLSNLDPDIALAEELRPPDHS